MKKILITRAPATVSVIADPFCGEGDALSVALEVFPDASFWCADVNPEALKKARERIPNATFYSGDSFQMDLPRADIIITNPPFTRWRVLDPRYRSYLKYWADVNGIELPSQPSLFIPSIFLADMLLNPGGLLVTVLPASVLHSSHSRPLRELLTTKYWLTDLIIGDGPFSKGSKILEIILGARKGVAGSGVTRVVEDGSERYVVLGSESWLTRIRPELQAVRQGLSRGDYIQPLNGKVVRGLEMYGPEVFFVPNRFWDIVDEDAHSVVLSNGSEEIEVPRDYLVPSFRRLSEDVGEVVTPSKFALAVPSCNSLPEYFEWAEESGLADRAKARYGEKWCSHIHRQLMSKKPYGHLFLPDKLDKDWIRDGKPIARVSPIRATASKNFYVARVGLEEAMRLGGYLNSDEFRGYLLRAARPIGNRLLRFLWGDWNTLPVPKRVVRAEIGLDDQRITAYAIRSEGLHARPH